MEFQVFQMEAQFVAGVRNSRSLANTIRRNFTKIQKDGKDMMSKEYRMKIPISLYTYIRIYIFQGVALIDQELARTVYMGHRPLLLVSNPDTTKAIMKTFLPRNEMKYSLLNADDDQWRFLRNTLLPTFSSGKMRMMEPLFKAKYEQLLDNLTERVKTGNPIDFKDVFGAYTLDVIASTGFGMDIDSQKNPDNDFVKYTKKFLNISFTPILILIRLSSKLQIPFLFTGAKDLIKLYPVFVFVVVVVAKFADVQNMGVFRWFFDWETSSAGLLKYHILV
uniref:Cytochrome P450 3A4 n=1 Tax=Magallana gigas TaxID=29159 RepID=K1PZI0_MAGGI